MAIKIVTDSTADLPPELVSELDIAVVPLKVHFGDVEYLDGIDLDPDSFFAKLQASDIIPRTSQPSPADFEAVYGKIAQQGDTIISIHLSAQLSGTYQSAMIAKEALPELDIEIFDSQTGSMALGMVVLEAARAVKAGKSKAEITVQIKENLQKAKVFFAVDTLEYLQKNGRIGKAAALLGGLLHLKPLLTLKDGIIVPKEKVRGKAKVQQRLIEIIGEEFGPDVQGKAVVLHTCELAAALKMKEIIEAEYNFSEVLLAAVGSVIGTHLGPGVLAIAVLPD
ncbi:MAG TPA: DegV family protein [Firmicutes bacterium]|nr:DegV family protein [Bacillota bacterium]HAA37980.1 DegV family protein [Bacillota bacterium]